MNKKRKKELVKARENASAFDDYYKSIYSDRWNTLKEALLLKTQTVPFSNNLIKPYYLDEASILVASILPIKGDEKILDMCAAPGGKTLVLSSFLKTGTILANDRSRDRKSRLDKVIKEHLAIERQEMITTTNRNAALFYKDYPSSFDCVLLDAPCSSERHVINDEKHLALWNISRPKRLAIEQFGLLCSALEVVKVGGYILYSTCAITNEEDEEVIKKLLFRRKDRFEVVPFELEYAEDREFGKIILPDKADGKGPLYAALLKRIS